MGVVVVVLNGRGEGKEARLITYSGGGRYDAASSGGCIPAGWSNRWKVRDGDGEGEGGMESEMNSSMVKGQSNRRERREYEESMRDGRVKGGWEEGTAAQNRLGSSRRGLPTDEYHETVHSLISGTSSEVWHGLRRRMDSPHVMRTVPKSRGPL